MPLIGLRQVFDVARLARQAGVPGPFTHPDAGALQPVETQGVDGQALDAQAFEGVACDPPGGRYSADVLERMAWEADQHPLEDSQPEWESSADHPAAAGPGAPHALQLRPAPISIYDLEFHPNYDASAEGGRDNPLAVSDAGDWDTVSRTCDTRGGWRCILGFASSHPPLRPGDNRIDELIRTKDQGDVRYFQAQLRGLGLPSEEVARAVRILRSQLGKDEL